MPVQLSWRRHSSSVKTARARAAGVDLDPQRPAAPDGQGRRADGEGVAYTTVRGVALDVIRSLRAARTSNAHRRATNHKKQQDLERILPTPNGDQVRAALRVRLSAAIMMEWRAAKGAGRSTDGRAQQTRPYNEAQFLDRWGAVAEISDGRCVTHTQRLEPGSLGHTP